MALSGEMLILHPVKIFFSENFLVRSCNSCTSRFCAENLSNSVDLILGLFLCEFLERKIDQKQHILTFLGEKAVTKIFRKCIFRF